MHRAIAEFVGILRQAGVGVSPAEHMDALEAAATTGCADRAVLKAALAACLAKSPSAQKIFDKCFDAFFSVQPFFVGWSHVKGIGGVTGDGLSSLASVLLSGDQGHLAAAVADAAQSVGLQGAVSMFQRGLYVQAILRRLNVDLLNQDVDFLRSSGGAAAKSQYLEEAREALVTMVRSYVDVRLRLHHEPSASPNLDRTEWDRVRLSHGERRDVDEMHRLTAAMIRRIQARYGRRRTRERLGRLDFKDSIRRSLGTQGLIFDPQWKRPRPDRPEVVVLCDVSRSVRHVTRFFLFFLYNLNRLVSKIRSFVFCSNLVEVTDIFRREPLERALARIETGQGLAVIMGLTDYGKTFEDFAARYLKSISRRTTMVVLGDARNNHDDPAEGAFRRIRDRVRRLVWLNPEPEPLWDTGDSVINVYRPMCDVLMPCHTMGHLERLARLIAVEPVGQHRRGRAVFPLPRYGPGKR